MTLAAFLLCAGVWYSRLDDKLRILPTDDLQQLGLSEWGLSDAQPRDTSQPDAQIFRELADLGLVEPRGFHARLGELIWKAFTSRATPDLANAVIWATASPDPLIRICALISASEIFRISLRELLRRVSEINIYDSETTSALTSILFARVLRASMGAVNPIQSAHSFRQAKPGLMLVHGTNFPPSRPAWSVPGTGPLFQHIHGFRADIYGSSDYFRWEGGYSSYAREVAALNLSDWIQLRGLDEIDAVTHSHGGNVLMGATSLGRRFGRVVFLSCPVRWAQYRPQAGSIKKARSIRIRLDLVILADRAAQRFPANSIPEELLPLWFVRHGDTTAPATWRNHSLDQYIA